MCKVCGLNPEYCEWSSRGNDLDACKKWLAEAHPALFEELYVVAEGDEEAKEGDAPKKKKRGAKKVGFSD